LLESNDPFKSRKAAEKRLKKQGYAFQLQSKASYQQRNLVSAKPPNPATAPLAPVV
jgi:hypothetical protein